MDVLSVVNYSLDCFLSSFDYKLKVESCYEPSELLELALSQALGVEWYLC
jgi:hypothetical protein